MYINYETLSSQIIDSTVYSEIGGVGKLRKIRILKRKIFVRIAVISSLYWKNTLISSRYFENKLFVFSQKKVLICCNAF